MPNEYKIVDTHSPDYSLVDGIPFNKFDAGAELVFQLEKFFPGMFLLEEISSRQGTGGMKESLFKCSFTPEETSENHFYIYALEIESGGRDKPFEHRVQFRHNFQWNPKLADLAIMTQFCQEKEMLKNKECYVIGITKHDSDDHDVIFSSFHPSNLLTEESKNIETEATSPKSIQVKVQFIQEAYLNDISCQHKEDGFNVINYKPQYFLWYMANRDELHLADIQKVNELINKARSEKYLRPVSQIPVCTEDNQKMVISALRTKPFILLAGISGTGKSRKVQELAYLTCKRDGIHDKDETVPGNYMLIPVKPNWHDSTELLGYYSSITGKYVLTDFIRFVWKAWVHKDVPYFLCLDEMNLAPVEQYFAEYLSVLETRKLVYDEEKKEWHIQTAEILSKMIFENLTTEIRKEPKDKVITLGNTTSDDRAEIHQLYQGEDIQIINFLKENGLRLPENLFVIGTVNMDDTTHQFSRKVIDRAFTIEMNGDELTKMFDAKDTLAYLDDPMTIDDIKPLYVKAQEVLEAYQDDAETIKTYVPELLNRINGEGIFKDTPFRVSYRVQNELVLYYASIRPQGDLTPEKIKPYLQEAFMAILLEKILPRVEGDEKAMKCNEKGDSKILLNIKQYLNEMKPIEGEPSPTFNTLIKKLDEMNERVKNSYFTSFFS